MPARRGRPRKGDLRIDKAIDHFAVMGYDARVIRAIVADLLKVYGGGPDAWHLLEEGPYEIVQDRLFEIEDEEKQKQDQQQQDGQQVDDEPPQHQEPAGDEEVEDPMFIEPQDKISISKVHNEVPEETKSADEEVEGPMFIEQLALEAALPLNATIRTGPRRPCYGWLSESEDEEEETSGACSKSRRASPVDGWLIPT